ncbi:MAG TPA: glycosyltransferase family 2 protein [Vicinamibacterales bacterium]|nr:glycosyltransferase family 2 protein [Vicinamibacterales bacterium]
MEPLLSIIVPVYNERATIGAVLDRLLSIELPVAREIIAVNDGSRDGTAAELDGAARRSPLVTVVHLAQNGGKGLALRTGLARTRGSIVAIQDADLELDPAQLGALVGPVLRDDADAVYGSRFMRGASHVPFMTRFGNASLTMLTNVLYGSALTDMETCYKIMRGDLARSLPLTANRFEIEPEITVMLLRRGARIIELPVTFSPRSRAAGKKIRWRDGWHAVDILLRHRFR